MDLLSHTFHCLSFVTVLEGRRIFDLNIYQGDILTLNNMEPNLHKCIVSMARALTLWSSILFRKTARNRFKRPQRSLHVAFQKASVGTKSALHTYHKLPKLYKLGGGLPVCISKETLRVPCSAHYLRMIIRIRRRKPWWWRSRRWWAPYIVIIRSYAHTRAEDSLALIVPTIFTSSNNKRR